MRKTVLEFDNNNKTPLTVCKQMNSGLSKMLPIHLPLIYIW